MKPPIICLLGLCAALFVTPIHAQDKKEKEKLPYRFGKVTPEDFKPKVYAIDSAADAVILADVGNTEYNGNSGLLEVMFKRYTRVHILHKAGYDAANFSIYLNKGYSNSTDDRVSDLKAVTYNLENGQVTETKLDSKSVFINKLSEDLFEEKFTLPNVKEGSIIEVTYSTHSFSESNLPGWIFQGEYPRIWTEYNVSIPEWFNFVFLRQGYYSVNESHSDRRQNFNFRYEPDGASGRTETVNMEAKVTDWRFISHNMPALRVEHYTTTLRNHVQSIEFQLGSITTPDGVTKNRMGSWSKLRERLMESEYFGATIDKNNGFLADVVNSVTAGASNNEEKARRLYTYVQKNFTCTDNERLTMDATSVKTVFNNKKGNSAELNLLLVAMLRRAGLESWPIILSTRDHGITLALYPILRRFNYTITYLQDGDNEYVMDASKPLLGFNHLPLECYNGHARLLTPDVPPVYFVADSIKEQSVTSVMAVLDKSGDISGSYQQLPGYYSSYSIREAVKTKGKEEFFKNAGKAFASDAAISETNMENLDSLDIPLTESFEFKLQGGDEDHIYLAPLWGEVQKENPFAAAERRYPVEIPYLINEIYTLNLQLPDNYEIEELPKPALVKLNDADGIFQYLVQGSGSSLQLRCVIRLNRANFKPEEYNDLREFYNYIVKKEAEQIVLKKKA
ncbi:Transglutaminase-like enzyme, putative cysteine protease [Chitinophaga costaii]|uniref:Transglutaminase-like enzyme, putative cysteine protease n=1 Tax=Chitinophaga costaii TaxID=1335309 RepID=A0A1C4CC53_9BACT|nr:transglutaminase domain-containing protein [Chitinophaga costaii]PUZ27150.1 DUF3858 domain-containing protein [Chitinophaga costaii]SCC16665.1 Transglutaminase-like enzyme, putative cysteine protease [Chitinophaga costaii]